MPPQLNLGVVCADRHPANALALVEIARDGSRRDYTFGDLSQLSNRFANALRAKGVRQGDRVALMLSQQVELGVSHLALYKIGAVAVPLSVLFGPDAVRHRLENSGARFIVTASDKADTVTAAVDLADVELILVDSAPSFRANFWSLIKPASDDLEAVATTPDAAALLIYTSGTTGPAKGALHAHRALLGHLPGFTLSHDYFPHDGDLFWTPADWAWIGGLMDVLLPAWYYGRPVVAAAHHGFDPDWAVSVMSGLGVRNAFLPPTALKLMRQAKVDTSGLRLRSVMSGGESLGEEMLDWGQDHLGVTINEIYGQTEANYVVGNCAAAWAVRPGAIGRPYPGHRVEVHDSDEQPVAAGEIGEIVVRVQDPVIFLQYWNQPDATRAKFSSSGQWLLTGDLGMQDSEGYLWFRSPRR